MNSNYCSAVDTGLFVYVNGEVKLCCSGTYPFGNIRKQPISEIFQSQKFIKIYDDIRNNVPTDYCSGCDQIESTAPGSSQRSAFNDQFPNPDSRHLRLVDVRWSNVCNLTCRYCNVNDSSEWRRLHNLPIETVNKDYIESLFEEIEQNVDTVDNLYLLGGEPLLQKHNIRLLDTVKPTTKIDLLTNLSVKLDNNLVYQKLKNFPNVLWNLSFDNIGERFEYVRQGAVWDVFLQNLDTLCRDFGAHRVTFHPVYTIWNCTNLQEFYEFASKQNFRVNWQLALPKVDSAYGLASDSFVVFGHRAPVIEQAIREIESLAVVDPTLTGIKNSLINDIEKPLHSQNFLSWTARMEQFMPPAKPFQELWPGLNTLLTE